MKNVSNSKFNSFKKILSIAFKILYNILVLFCAALIIVIVFQRASDSNKSICGYRLFRIVSGSMVPRYNIDEVVVCKDIDLDSLKIGDIVVYRGNIGQLKGKLVMHEIININESENGRIFHVKGIQNTTGDPDVRESQILGKVVFESTVLSYLYYLATNVYSSFIIIMVLVINVFISFKPKKQEVIKLNECNDDVIEEKKEVVPEKNEDNENNVEEIKRYKLKHYENDIKIIRKNKILDNKNNDKNAKEK